jgi:hypothetical protein
LALTWLLRGARGALNAVVAPAATPAAAKLAVAVACLGTATVPVAQTLRVGDGKSRGGLAAVADPARLSAAPHAPAGRSASTRADAGRRGEASVAKATPAARSAVPGALGGARRRRLLRDPQAATGAVPGGGDLGLRREPRDAVRGSVSALPGRLGDTLTLVRQVSADAPRQAVEAIPTVSHVVASTVRDVERALQPSSRTKSIPPAPVPKATPALRPRAGADPLGAVKALVRPSLRVPAALG